MIKKDVIIIGAGLTGLTTAYYLNKHSSDFCVLEKKSGYGGVIETVKENGFIYEKGPNTGTIGTIETVELFDNLTGICELEIANQKANKRYILKGGKWNNLPSGVTEGIKTKLFTTKDKFKLLAEPFLKRGNNPHETLAELVKRRMGQSFLDYAIDPFVIGIYSGDPAYLVPKYAFPKLYNLEQNYGSFIGGAIKKSFQKKDEQTKRVTRKIFSVKNGLSSLTEALYKSSNPDNFQFDVQDIKVKYKDNKFFIKANRNDKDIEYVCNKLVTTVGGHALKDILTFIPEESFSKIENLPYAKIIGCSMGFKNWQGINLDAFGGLIPFKEKRNILGYLFISSFLKNRAPENGALITCFLGGIRNPELFKLSDDKLKKIIKEETSELLGLEEFNPDLFKIMRYKKAIPQYGADSKVRLETIEMLQTKFPGLLLGGNIRDGIGMSDRIKQGQILSKTLCK